MMKSFPHILLTLIVSCSAGMAQYSELTQPYLPGEARRFFASDFETSTNLMVSVGDGVVTVTPGGVVKSISTDHGSRIFDGVAVISPQVAIASAADGQLLAINPLQRRTITPDGLPDRGTCVVRCGRWAVAICSSMVTKISATGNGVQCQAIYLDGYTPHLLSAADHSTVVALDTLKNKLVVLDVASGTVVSHRSVPGGIRFLQTLSDSCSAVIVEERSTLTLRVLNHTSDTQRIIRGFDAHSTTRIMARFTAGSNGGGAVVVHSGYGNAGKRQVFFARGAELDSIEHTTIGNERTRLLQSGVASWTGNNTNPLWHVTGAFFLHTTLTQRDGVQEVGTDVVPRDAFERRLSTNEKVLHCGTSRALLTVIDKAPFEKPTDRIPHLFSSWDGGRTWQVTPIRDAIKPLAISDDGTMLADRRGTLIVGNTQASFATNVLTPLNGYVDATMTGDTILVSGPILYRSWDRGRTWDSSYVAGYSPGPVAFASGGTIVLGGTPLSCITRDAGRTWTSFSFVTPLQVYSATVLPNGTVLGTFNNGSFMTIATDRGRTYGTPLPTGTLVSFSEEEVLIGTARGMRVFDVSSGQTTSRVLNMDPYGERGTTAMFSSGALSATPDDAHYRTSSTVAHNGLDRAWFLIGDRVKIIERSVPLSLRNDEPTSELTVYPNPADNQLVLPEGSITIYSMDGATAAAVSAADSRMLDVSQLPSGTYVVKNAQAGHVKTALVRIVH